MIEILPWAMLVTFLIMCAVTTAIYLVDRMAGHRYVRERHDLALAAFVMAPLVFLLVFRPADAVPVAPSSPLLAPAASAGADAAPALGDAPGDVGQASAFDIAEAVGSSPFADGPRFDISIASLFDFAPLLWAVGAMIGLFFLARDFAALMRLKAAAKPIPQRDLPPLTRQISVRRSEQVRAPLLAGYLQPAILAPRDFRIDEAGRGVLEHEVAHYVRGDHWTVLGLKLLRVLFWWLVPLKVLEAIISANRETLCDAQAARVTGKPKQLAHALLEAATDVARGPGLAVSAISSGSALAKRVRFLANKDVLARRGNPMGLPASLVGLGAMAVLFTPNLGSAISAQALPPSPAFGEVSPAMERRFERIETVQFDRFHGMLRLSFVEGRSGVGVSGGANSDVQLVERAGVLSVSSNSSNPVQTGPHHVLTLQLPAGVGVRFVNSSVTVEGQGPAGRIEASGNRRLDGVFSSATGLDIDHSGAGELVVARLFGDEETSLSLSGSGNLIILGGETPFLRAAMDGSGYLIYGGVAANARLTGDGDGSVYVGRVSGGSSLDITAHGTIGRRAEPFASRGDALRVAAEAAGRTP